MLSAKNLDNQIEQLWPDNGPSTKEVSKYLKKYQNEKIVIKCGGKVLLDQMLLDGMIEDIAILKKLGVIEMVRKGYYSYIKLIYIYSRKKIEEILNYFLKNI